MKVREQKKYLVRFATKIAADVLRGICWALTETAVPVAVQETYYSLYSVE